MTVAVRDDPPVPADGRCVQCGGQRSAHRKSKPLYREQANADPFCSTTCAREWHGVPLLASATTSRARADERHDTALGLHGAL